LLVAYDVRLGSTGVTISIQLAQRT
jgi:hypothetical protein